MKHFVRVFTAGIFILVMPGCSLLVKDCSTLSEDPAAFRQCLATQGNPKAQYELGLLAFNDQDYPVALKWLKLAAAASSGRTAVYMPPVGGQQYGNVMMMDGMATTGYAKAQILLAEIYDKGLGVKADPELAEHYRKLAQSANSPGYRN